MKLKSPMTALATSTVNCKICTS